MFSSPLTTADAINLGLVAIGVLTLAVGLYYSHKARIESVKTEQAAAYLSLEMYSSKVFKYEAQNLALLAPYQSLSRPDALRGPAGEPTAAGIAANLYFQTLNLFEVCTRFRKNGVIGDEIFASWVAWFYDIADDWYFRELWRDDMRAHYTPDLRAIFDSALAIFDRYGETDAPAVDRLRKRAFYQAVGDELDCDCVRGWLGPPEVVALQAAPGSFSFSWPRGSEERAQAAAFLARNLRGNSAYISHGEIQCGRSPDGRGWARDLEARLTEELAGLDESHSLFVAREGNQLVGVAIIAWCVDGTVSYAEIEDMAVDGARRSQGLGAAMVEEIETEARRRGSAWVFLESGLHNHRAHAFFLRHEYRALSKVFGKELIARQP